jgi:hypothetical protein
MAGWGWELDVSSAVCSKTDWDRIAVTLYRDACCKPTHTAGSIRLQGSLPRAASQDGSQSGRDVALNRPNPSPFNNIKLCRCTQRWPPQRRGDGASETRRRAELVPTAESTAADRRCVFAVDSSSSSCPGLGNFKSPHTIKLGMYTVLMCCG